MKYIELAFVVVCVVAIVQALGRRLPVPMAVLQIACGVALSSVVALDDLSEQSALLFVMLVPPLLYIEAWQVPKRELLRSIGPVLGLVIGLVTVTITVVGFGVHALLPEMPLAVAFALAAALASTDTVAVSNFVGRIALPGCAAVCSTTGTCAPPPGSTALRCGAW
jgi:NhaP-type Na+/H+ or K+/H+ antiporter